MQFEKKIAEVYFKVAAASANDQSKQFITEGGAGGRVASHSRYWIKKHPVYNKYLHTAL
jgi:hypothetical protein